ncbi:Sterol regulatory element-binding protein 1 [Physocladia obscura]|uniref:Sterol regulatory element-binding protein 1 n=1 Tax=Physocladia obscura TaxID=109957 RepID=A0AAD5T2I2_9FUNG|nr:Sterol regulatory element-binding protein 1 [Physocladia obscura]
MEPQRESGDTNDVLLQRWQQIMMPASPCDSGHAAALTCADPFALPASLDLDFLATNILDMQAFPNLNVNSNPASAAVAAESESTAPQPAKRKRGRPPTEKSAKTKPSTKGSVIPSDASEALRSVTGALASVAGANSADAASSETLTEDAKNPRRVTHNVIERRYRNNLNQRIAELRDSVPALNQPSTGPATSKKSKQVALEGEDLGSDDEQGASSGSRLNKGTILKKATEYIHELEDQVRNLKEQMDGFKLRVSQTFGTNGDVLIKEFFASLPMPVISPAPATSKNAQSPVSVTANNKRQKVDPDGVQKVDPVTALANGLGTGIALMQQQQQQIQNWLAIQQQYQAAAAAAAAASVEAFKSLSTSPPPSVPSDGMTSPTPISPENAFGGLFMGNPMNGIFGVSNSEIVVDSITETSLSNENDAGQSIFNYLFDFGNYNGQSTAKNGVQMLAMMFMSASVLYAPSPFDISGDGFLHEHVVGKVLGRVDAAPVAKIQLAGWMLKLLVVLFGIGQIVIALFRFVTRKKADAKRVPKSESAKGSAMDQLRQLALQATFPTSISSSCSILKVSIELCRFVSCFVFGFGCTVDALASIGRRNKTRQWHAAVCRTSIRILDELAIGDTVSSIQLFKISLVALSHASMAESAISSIEMSKIKLTCAMILKLSSKRSSSGFFSVAINSLAGWLWNDGLAVIHEIIVEGDEEMKHANIPRWLMETATDSGSLWTMRYATEYFESDCWIACFEESSKMQQTATPSALFKTLFAFSESTLIPQILDDFAASSSSILTTKDASPSPTVLHGVQPTIPSTEVIETFLQHHNEALTIGDTKAAFMAASLTMMACWRQSLPVPHYITESWTKLLAAAETTGERKNLLSTKISSLALFTSAMVRCGKFELAVEAITRLDDLLGLYSSTIYSQRAMDDCERLIATVEFASLSWLLETLTGGLERCEGISVKAVARMRIVLPAIARKNVIGSKSMSNGDSVKCVMGWMNVVQQLI